MHRHTVQEHYSMGSDQIEPEMSKVGLLSIITDVTMTKSH